MSKKEEKFRDNWVNHGALGKALNLSVVAIGKKLKELELRQVDGTPTAKAISESYCRAAHSRMERLSFCGQSLLNKELGSTQQLEDE